MKLIRIFLVITAMLLGSFSISAQITANGNTGTSMTSYTNGAANNPIYIWCANGLTTNSGSLTATPPSGTGPFTFKWYYHDAPTSSWVLYTTTTGATSTINNLPSDGYRVQIYSNTNVLIGCYVAWVWNMNGQVTTSVTSPSCSTANLNGTVAANSSFTYYNPPPPESLITASTNISVCFTATHTYASDLAFYLVGPPSCGSPVILLSPNPGAIGQGSICNSGDNVSNLCFSKTSTNNLNVCAGAPFTLSGTYGTYGPSNTPINWTPLIGCNAAAGGWTVQIYDCIGGDVGSLTNSTITFSNLASQCGSPTTFTYSSGAINSAITDMSCSAASASIFQVPVVPALSTPITINATVSYLWTASPAVAIPGASTSLTPTVTGLPAGSTNFTLTETVTYGSTSCTYTSSSSTSFVGANAGADGSIIVCDNSTAVIDLYSIITGEQTGGSWVRTTGTGGTFNAAAGTFTPSAGATSSTFTYTVAGVSPCPSDSSVATITINPLPNAGADNSITVCDNSTAVIDLYSIITGEQTGGSWVRTTGTGGTFNAAAGTFTPSAGATSSTFTYTVAGVSPCPSDSSVATITINPLPNAGADNSITVCDNSTTVIDLYSIITGEQTGGSWVRTTGTGGTFNAAAGTFTPSAGATSSTFTYTVAGVSPCPGDSSVATITINPLSNAGADNSITVCDNSTTVIDLYSIITGEQTGGSWVRTTGTGGTFNAAAGTFTPSAGATSSTFTYTVAGVSPCPGDSSVATITINPLPNAGADNSITVCDNSTTVIDLYSIITGEQTGGSWVRTTGTGGTFNAAAGTFTPSAGATSSTFTYTVAGVSPCPGDSSVATITINPLPNAGADNSITVCDNSTTVIDLYSIITGEQTGGSWVRTTGTGGTFNAAAGTFTPSAGATSSTFTYTVAGVSPCPGDSSVATITINPLPNAGADNSITVCDNSTTVIDLYSIITGEQTGGSWVRTTGTGGTFNAAAGTFTPSAGATSSTFTYTVAGVSPCPGDSSVATITINPLPNAGADNSITVCDNSTTVIDLYSIITGEQTGGSWVRTTGTGGTFNAAAGTFTPSAGATSSTFTYTVAGVSPCPGDSSVATITINPLPNAGADNSITVCDNSTTVIDLYSIITGEQTGGSWVRTTGTGGTFNAAAGTFTPSAGATSSTFTYTVAGVSPCPGDSSVATITINPLPNAGADNSITVCDNSTTVIDLYSIITGEQTGGSWVRTTGTGGTFNAAAGTFTPSAGATSSTFTYTVAGVSPCPGDSSVATITINPLPNAGADNSITVCDNSTTVIDLYSIITGEQTGGSWVRTTGTGGTFNAAAGTFTPSAGATSSTFTYTVAGVSPCPGDSSVATITINPLSNAGADNSITVCDNSTTIIDLYSIITGEQTGGSWVRTTGTGGTFNAAAGTFTPSAGATSSTFTYTVAGVSPCPGDSSVATITINPLPNAGADNSITVCDNSTAVIDLYSIITGEQTGGSWVRTTGTGGTFNAAAGTFTPSAGATSSTFTYTVAGVSPCPSDSSVATVNINAQPTAGTDGNTTVCDSDTTIVNLFSLITGEQTGGSWVRISGTGGTFNAAAGTYVPAVGATSSTFEYTVNGVAPCSNDTSVASITINPQPSVVATPASQTICSNTSTGISLTSAVSGTTYSWTVVQNGVTGASNGSGNAINQTLTATGITNGTVTYTITPTANGCIGNPITVAITVKPAPSVTATPTSEILCSGQVTGITLTSNMTGTTFSWTVSATGVSGAANGSGTVINDVLSTTTATAGTVVYTITPLHNGCYGVPINVVVTVIPKAILTATPLNQQICSGSSATINLSSNMLNTVYSWSFNQTGVTGASSGLNVATSSISHALTLVDPFVQGVVVYTITPIVNNCPGNPVQVTVIVKPIPDVMANPNQETICSGDATNISLTSSVPGTTYSWVVSQNGVLGATPGSGSTIQQTLSTVSFVSGTVDYVITPFNGGCAGTPITVTVTVNPLPQVIGSSSYTICSGEPTAILLSSFVAGTTFDWTVVQNGVSGASVGSSSGDIIQTLYTTGPNDGTVTYTVTPTASGCSGSPIYVTVYVKASPVSGMDEGTICIDSVTGAVLSTHLLDTGLNNVDYDFTWYFNGIVIPGATGSTYVATAPGDYSVDIINTNTGCTSDPDAVENTVTVVESNPGILMQMYVNEAFSNNPTITVVVSGAGVYQYQIDGGIPQSSNVFTGILPGSHTIVVTDENGCTYIEDTIYVIGYPHFFTPNGDNINDTWNVWDLSDDQPNAEILIFDRYGKLIKQIIPGGNGWNGTYNGHELPSTDYWFTIRFKDGPNLEERIFKSHFSLKR